LNLTLLQSTIVKSALNC